MTRIAPVRMTVRELLDRPMAEVQNYASDVVPLHVRWEEYGKAFRQMLRQVPGEFYAVANFNLRDLEPEWCRSRFNLFDMKIARCLLGKNWSKRPESERPSWIAIPEHAAFLHYNLIWQVPVQHHERFFFRSPEIWREVVPSGQFHLQVVGEGRREAARVRGYSGKTFHPRWTLDHTITSRELRPPK